MELITRHIVKKRGDAEVTYEFTTYDFVLSRAKNDRFHPNFTKMVDHLHNAFVLGMPQRETSASAAKRLALNVERLEDHEFSRFARASQARGRGREQHPTVQKFFLQNNMYSIGMEVPVWDEKMSALIDILLFNPVTGIVSILDYKPDASKEKKAATQVYHQKRLLALCSKISPKFIECFYFDDLNTYKLKA